MAEPKEVHVALVEKNLSANVGDVKDPGSARYPGKGHSNPVQFS